MSKPEKKEKKFQKDTSGYIFYLFVLQNTRHHPNEWLPNTFFKKGAPYLLALVKRTVL